MLRSSCLLLLMGSTLILGCEPPAAQKPSSGAPVTDGPKVTSEDVRRDTDKAVRTAAEYSKQSKDEFMKGLETRIQELDVEIAKLQVKGAELKDQAKVNWDRKMVELEAKRKVAQAKLTEVGKSSAEAWKDIQKGAQSAWEELDHAFREAAKEF